MRRKSLPKGIKFISYIYLVNAIFYLASLALFFNYIIILGNLANEALAWAIRLVFLGLPIYLYFNLRLLKKSAWLLAVYFHTFFLINNSLIFAEHYGYLVSLIRITGINGPIAYSPIQMFFFVLNTIINLLLLSYLLKKRQYFLKSTRS